MTRPVGRSTLLIGPASRVAAFDGTRFGSLASHRDLPSDWVAVGNGLTGDFATGADLPVPTSIVVRVHAACAHLPEAHEEHRFEAVRWRIRGRTLAHLQSREVEDQVLTYVTFHAREELDDLLAVGHPFHPGWGPGLIAMVLTDDDATDWDDVRELLTESYRLLAPKKLVARLP